MACSKLGGHSPLTLFVGKERTLSACLEHPPCKALATIVAPMGHFGGHATQKGAARCKSERGNGRFEASAFECWMWLAGHSPDLQAQTSWGEQHQCNLPLKQCQCLACVQPVIALAPFTSHKFSCHCKCHEGVGRNSHTCIRIQRKTQQYLNLLQLHPCLVFDPPAVAGEKCRVALKVVPVEDRKCQHFRFLWRTD